MNWRHVAIALTFALGIGAASLFAASEAPAQSTAPFCVTGGHQAHQIRMFIPPRVTLYSEAGERIGTVSRESLSNVKLATDCENRRPFVMIHTPNGPRLAPRSNISLGQGLAPPCPCQTVASGAQVGATSMGAADGPVCNPDLPRLCE